MMEEKVNELRNYLPIYFESKENNEYVEYLTSAYLKNVEAEKYQFSFIAFHILYMCFIYKTIWSLKKNGDTVNFNAIMNSCRHRNKLSVYSSLFDISVLGEADSFNFIKLFPFHQNDIDKFSHTVSQFNGHSTRLSRWNAEERTNLFPLLKYNLTPNPELKGCWPKIGSLIEESIWNKLFRRDKPLSTFYAEKSSFVTYYSRKVNAFLQILNFVPEVRDGKGHLRPPSEFKELFFSSKKEADAVFCCFNSTLFRWFMDAVSDGSHVNRREVDNFRFDPRKVVADFPEISNLAARLSSDLNSNSESRKMRYKHDTLTVQCIIPKKSKPIIDEIDRVLAKHYGFTDEELDFIINYDIKYRMGRESEEGE